MRVRYLSLVTLLLAFAACGFAFWWVLGRLTPALPNVARPAAEPDAVRRDLCQLARAESAFFRGTSHYASEVELRSTADASLPATGRWPYEYAIYVPVPDQFVILAIAQKRLEKQPPALVIYPAPQPQVCSLTSELPQFVWKSDSTPQNWGDNVTYDCENCPSEW